jgi:type VI secretion system protein ImpE
MATLPAQTGHKMAGMTPMELFHEARLSEALEAQRTVVAGHSEDVIERTRLAAFLAFAGKYREALGSIPDRSEPELRDYCLGWRMLLRADLSRMIDEYLSPELALGQWAEEPSFLMEPPASIQDRVEVFEARGSDDDRIWQTLEEGDERANQIEGHIDGRPFVGWRDADDFLGPVLEAFVFDTDRPYKWLPLEQICRLRVHKAEDVRDLLYRPAYVSLIDGTEWDLYIPVLYAGSAWHGDDGIRTGAGVDWVARNELVRGLGGRTFLFGEEELTLDEFTQVETRN